MTLWSHQEATNATGGQSTANWEASGVCIDTRSLQKSDLFVALKGTNTDGHDFLGQAFEAGAAAAMVTHTPPDGPPSLPLLTVDTVLNGLKKLAHTARTRTPAKIIAITGSVGKTGTKEMLKTVLSDFGPTYATPGNFNNDLGVPLSLANLPKKTDYAVFEIGMNHPGEIKPLSEMVRPDVALITNIEMAHLGHFSNLEEIADEKADIFKGLELDGIALLNRDSPFFERLQPSVKQNIYSFGMHHDAAARLLEVKLYETYSLIKADICGKLLKYRLSLAGEHWALNSLSVLLTVFALNQDVEQAAEALGRVLPVQGRGKRYVLNIKNQRITLIDESYNASPISMKMALKILGKSKGRKIAVLGDMLELGEQSVALHQALLETLKENNVDQVFTCGEMMRHLFEALPETMRGAHTPKSVDLAPLLLKSLSDQDTVLLKGSAGTHLSRLVTLLRQHDHAL